jgi:diguanylate cyclase (GGDEF)-like protein/PAS domain S-box-containing protein
MIRVNSSIVGISLEEIYQNVPIALCLIGRDGRLIAVNKIHTQLAGRRTEELVGARVADLNEEGGKNVERDFRHFDSGKSVPIHELEIGSRHYMVSTSPILDAQGAVIAIFVAHLDVSDRKAVERKNERLARKLKKLSVHDHLTGLFNRREFDRLLRVHINGLRRFGHEFSLILFDVDHFKAYNDLHGHQAGDQCLADIAKAAKRTLRRHESCLCRYGGEEFSLLVKVTEPAEAEAISERIRTSVRGLSIQHEAGIGGIVSVSCGVVSTVQMQKPLGATFQSDLFTAVDGAMYQAKNQGRNKVRVFKT